MSLVRNTLTQSSLTLASRTLGFVRDILIAAKVGAGPIGDAFVTALMFPNLFRRIFAEGAFSQAFVPAYARTLEAEGKAAADDIARQVLRGLFAATAGMVIVAQLAMPWIMLVIHGGYERESESFQLAILLTQITMPYLACMALAALLSGVLNSGGRFVLSAGAPTVLNLFLIAAALLGDDNRQTAFYAAIAVSAAGLAQAALLWWGVSRQKVSLSLGWPKLTPGVKKVVALAIPGTIAASGTQINILVSQALASFEPGAKSWLFYADRLYQLPLGLVGVAVGVAILPRLARAARSDDGVGGKALMDDGIGLAMALTLPAAIALMVAPAYLIEGLYARGAFLISDAQQAGRALVHYGWGVPAFVLIKVLAPAYFAREDTKTPMRFALMTVALNTVLGAGLFVWFRSMDWAGFPGLAIATSIAAWVNVSFLFLGLMRRGWYTPGGRLITRLISIALASLAMGGVLYLIGFNLAWFEALLPVGKFLQVLVYILIGGLTYAVASVLFGAIRLSDLKAMTRRA
ncbi:MAG: murein biosynthesis integral membrane protein MurJ [Henriciella sp.]|nr:murein biosynthesis integral membrane protein MurJ [Henriciella sp.]